jgi:hypothetical protein
MLLSVVVVVAVEVSAVVQEVEVFDSIDSTTHTHTINLNQSRINYYSLWNINVFLVVNL